MKHNVLFLFVITLLLIQAGIAEEDSLKYRHHWEVSGQLFYSSTVQSNQPGYQTIDIRTYTWALQPGIAWFVDDHIQFGLDIRYQLTRREVEWPFDHETYSWSSVSYSGNLMVAIGPGYNLPIGPSIWAFVNLKMGLVWIHEGGSTPDVPDYSYWSQSKIVFPIIQGGLKYFVVRQCAAVIQLQYDRISYDPQSTFSVGVGLAVYP